MQHAITTLQVALEALTTNEPINRAEGNVEQADHEATAAEEIRKAINLLAVQGTKDVLASVDEAMAKTPNPTDLQLAGPMLDAPSWQTSPAPVPVAPVEEIALEFNLMDNTSDFGLVVAARGRRGGINHLVHEPVKKTRPSQTDDDRRRHITEAKQRAAERVAAWFAERDADGNLLDNGRQQDA